MRAGIVVSVTPQDRIRLEAIVADRNTRQKHAARARVIVATAEGCGTTEIMRRSGLSKPAVWRWQERFMHEGVDGLLRDKTRKPGKPPLLSFTMLTMNATDHNLLRDYHRPDDEKRIIVILPESQYSAWLNAPASEGMDFIRHYPADKLVATPVAPKLPKIVHPGLD